MEVKAFRIDQARLQRIQEAAELEGVSFSAIVREGATREALARLGLRDLEAEDGQPTEDPAD